MLELLLGPVVPLAHALQLTGVALAWLGSASAAGLLAGLWLLRFLRADDGAVSTPPQPHHEEP
jgi:hypothetical protein